MRPVLLALLLFAAPFLRATTYLVPTDAELIQRADDIVIATGVASLPGEPARTQFVLRIEEVLKGVRAKDQHLVVSELGGRAGDRTLIVAGAPAYEPGVRYLVFTESGSQGEPITFGMSLGQFELDGGRAFRRGISGFDRNLEPHVERERDASAFIDYIRGIVAQRADPEASYFVTGPRTLQVRANATSGITRASYLLTGSFRWQTPGAKLWLSGVLPGSYDVGAAAARAVAEWNGTESSIEYAISGRNDALRAGLKEPDGSDAILFGDPNNEVPSGVIASGGAWGEGDYTYAGEPFVSILEADVVFNTPFNASQSCLYTVMTHELGHTLGIRHANRSGSERACLDATADCAKDAIMKAEVICGLEGRLRGWDKRAAAAVYGAGPPAACDIPDVKSQTQSKRIGRGESVELTLTASGTGTLTIQWYEGERGDQSRPVGSGAQVTVKPSSSTRYWALVTNSCGSDDSAAVIITVGSPKRRSIGRG